jgi:hypothetical protein
MQTRRDREAEQRRQLRLFVMPPKPAAIQYLLRYKPIFIETPKTLPAPTTPVHDYELELEGDDDGGGSFISSARAMQEYDDFVSSVESAAAAAQEGDFDFDFDEDMIVQYGSGSDSGSDDDDDGGEANKENKDPMRR